MFPDTFESTGYWFKVKWKCPSLRVIQDQAKLGLDSFFVSFCPQGAEP